PSARTGLDKEPGEIGQLARAVDQLAARIEKHAAEGAKADHRQFTTALQQTAVAALGQFALTSADFSALLNQAVILITQTLEVELCWILELLPDGKSMVVRAGGGWKKDIVGLSSLSADRSAQAGYALASGEPVVISDLRKEARFQ